MSAERPAVLVTGGGGFFGHQVVKQLVSNGWAPRVLDQAPVPPWAGELGVDYRRGDTRDRQAVTAAMEGVSAVLHAAFAPPERPADDVWRVNTVGTRTVLGAALAGTRPRVVLVSSTIVDRPLRPHPFLRSSPLSRLAVYRDSRIAAEAEATNALDSGLRVALARPKTFLGPGGLGAFALLFELIRRGRQVPLLGSGDNVYQLVDVRDLAAGICLLLASDACGCFSFGSTRFASVAEDLGVLVEHAGTGATLRPLPAGVSRAGLRALELLGLSPLSEWHQLSARGIDSVVDTSRALDELGWRPQRGNVEALTESYDWYAGVTEAHSAPGAGHRVPVTHRALQRLADTLPGARKRHSRGRPRSPARE